MRKPAAALAALALTLVISAAPALAAPTPGSVGLGDSFFPNAGNGGYDVGHYDLKLRYDPGNRRLVAKARIDATATQDLSAFNLDYAGPKIGSVQVGGVKAGFERSGRELTVTPAAPIANGAAFRAKVAYSGRPGTITDEDGSREGWFETDDGALAIHEPRGAITWFPCNDTLLDKAYYRIAITVPKRLKGISNGALEKVRRHGRWKTFQWAMDAPMSTYLALVGIGRYKLDRSPIAGLESVIAVDPRLARQSRKVLGSSAKIVRYFKRLFGPYPFGQAGALIDDAKFIGYALENQTRPFFPGRPDPITYAHEYAHQWFGDSVGLARWQDIWLNESFATWAEWRWDEEKGGPTTAETFAGLLMRPASESNFWNPPTALPGGPRELFTTSTYARGAMALEALRQHVGEPVFLEILSTWSTTYRWGNATTEDFIALSEAVSGQQLDSFFENWLYKPGKPAH